MENKYQPFVFLITVIFMVMTVVTVSADTRLRKELTTVKEEVAQKITAPEGGCFIRADGDVYNTNEKVNQAKVLTLVCPTGTWDKK
jgi:hypothetical protein